MSEAHILSSFPASFQRFSLKFGENIARYIIRQKNGVEEFSFFASFKTYDYFSEENACFINSQSLTASETNQTSNKNFQTQFFKERCQEDIAILIAFSRSNPTRNELD